MLRDNLNRQWPDSELDWAHTSATKRLKKDDLIPELRASTFNRALAYELRRGINAKAQVL